MVAARILDPHTKLATTRWWHATTLAEEYGVVQIDATDLYAAMDWLLERQGAIQKKLAARYLSERALALYSSGKPDDHSWHIFAPLLFLDELAINRGNFIKRMQERGIGVNPAILPFRYCGEMGHRPGDLPMRCASGCRRSRGCRRAAWL